MKNTTTLTDLVSSNKSNDNLSNSLSFEEFMLKLSAYFSVSVHLPDLNVSSFEVNDYIQNHHQDEYEKVITSLGYVDEDGKADEEEFIKTLVRYVDRNPLLFDGMAYGSLVVQKLHQFIPVNL